MKFTETTKQSFASILQKRLRAMGKERIACPICGFETFILANGFAEEVIQDQDEGARVSDKSIPEMVVACENCGYVMKFALGLLGMLADNSKSDRA